MISINSSEGRLQSIRTSLLNASPDRLQWCPHNPALTGFVLAKVTPWDPTPTNSTSLFGGPGLVMRRKVVEHRKKSTGSRRPFTYFTPKTNVCSTRLRVKLIKAPHQRPGSCSLPRTGLIRGQRFSCFARPRRNSAKSACANNLPKMLPTFPKTSRVSVFKGLPRSCIAFAECRPPCIGNGPRRETKRSHGQPTNEPSEGVNEVRPMPRLSECSSPSQICPPCADVGSDKRKNHRCNFYNQLHCCKGRNHFEPAIFPVRCSF
mmetsp:Transcript_60196/g.160131  ORF Transcript_60196/g.160131 Transcript_60196/m.160131 type:complete len:262 (+) Transcript_60196:2915-3700(+)